MDKYKLHANEWLVGLYDERQRWVPAFVKDTFWAGMSTTTQRSEREHECFLWWVCKFKNYFKQFVEQYENALLDKVEKENRADLQLHIFVVWRHTTLKHNIWMLIRLFEFRGVLCRHIIVVLIEKKIFRILDKYILRRWRKDVKRSHSKVRISSEDWTAKSEAQRFDKMWQT